MSRRFLTCFCLPLLVAGFIGDLAPARAQSAAPPASPVSPAAINFCSPRTVLWLGRTAVLPFRVSQASDADDTFHASVADTSLVEITRDPALLAGETTGYLRVRALRPGHTRLTLRGSAAIDLEIKADPAAAAFAQIDVESDRPRIVSPMADAVVWGQFAVGVEVFDAAPLPPDPSVAQVSNPPAPAAPAGTVTSGGSSSVRLRLPNGQMLDPVAITGTEMGPVRHYQFNVPADALPAGSLPLVAVSTPVGFSDVDRRAGRGVSLESQPLVLRNLRNPRPDSVYAGECESPDIMGPTKNLYAPARPPRFGTQQPNVDKDAAASGGQTVNGNSPWVLPLVVKQPGEYQFFIQTRGNFGGGAYATAALYLDNSEMPLGSVRLTGPKYQRLPVGTPFRLDAGPQTLTIAFKNGFGHDSENRNFYLDRYELVRLGEGPAVPLAAAPKIAAAHGVSTVPLAPSSDYRLASLALPAAAAPPRLDVLYPAENARIFGVDAVVGRVSGLEASGARPAWADLLIDGQPQNVRLPSPAPGGPLVFPLLARGIAPGPHRLALRMADLAGQTTDSPARTLIVLAERPFVRGPYERAVYLLDRLAFGPEPRELAAVLTMGERAWLDNRMAAGFDTPTEQALLQMTCQRYPHVGDGGQTAQRTLGQWIASDNPVRSRFTAWAENHFSTWMNKIEPTAQWRSHLDFCRLGVAPFGDLLSASAHSPAMLVYLDQARSYAGKLNENYAREIMELHTLGVHGGYKQTDVTALASVLNGWTVTREALVPQEEAPLQLVYNGGNDAGLVDGFRFAPVLSDGKGQRVFGMQFPAVAPALRYDRVRLALEMLASHPSTAEHVCRKLAEHYVGAPAPDPLVSGMAAAYLESGGDMRAVLRAMVAREEFWSATPKMATPFDYGMRFARLCRASVVQSGADPDKATPNPEQLEGFLKKSGMGIFDRVTPDGYPEDDGAYADSNALLQRWHFMESMSEALNRLVPKAWRTPPAVAPRPAANVPYGPPTAADAVGAQRFVDLAAVRLTGRLLTPASNQGALDVLGSGASPEEFTQTILFVSLLPETSLR